MTDTTLVKLEEKLELELDIARNIMHENRAASASNRFVEGYAAGYYDGLYVALYKLKESKANETAS